jgi:hypothetical protein
VDHLVRCEHAEYPSHRADCEREADDYGWTALGACRDDRARNCDGDLQGNAEPRQHMRAEAIAVGCGDGRRRSACGIAGRETHSQEGQRRIESYCAECASESDVAQG